MIIRIYFLITLFQVSGVEQVGGWGTCVFPVTPTTDNFITPYIGIWLLPGDRETAENYHKKR